MTVTGTRFPLADQHVMVVGGSSGIGFATARLAKLAGAQITFVARNRVRLREAAESMCGAQVLNADLDDATQISNLFEGVPEIDHLVITIGTATFRSLKEADSRDLHRILNDTVIGPLWMIKCAIKRLSKTGSVTLTSGPSTYRLVGMEAVTAGSVAAIETIGRALAMELWPVRVNVVSPGMTDTSLLDLLLGAEMTPILSDAGAALPASRISNADDVAHAVLFLMSASAVTGEVLRVDGSGRWAGNSGSLGSLTLGASPPRRTSCAEQHQGLF